MAKQGGLGRGLGALIPSDIRPGVRSDGPQYLEVAIEHIVPNPNQPRVHFDEESLNDLSASIREIGVLQPVLIREAGEGKYELIAGERRWRAARRAGLTMIPAVLGTVDQRGSVERALIENLHRQDLTPLEEAAAYQQLIDDFQLTHEQVATRVGKSRASISNTLRLMSLPAGIQALLADGRLSAGHAKALLGTPDRTLQEQLARQAVAEGWSVRALEDAVRGPVATADEESVTDTPNRDDRPNSGIDAINRKLPPPGLLELEQLLADYLSTRVSVSLSAKRGKVVIEFADLEDLERICHQMTS
jgi:ParB family chromosome partitioning protein